MNKRLLGGLISSLLPVCNASALSSVYSGYIRPFCTSRGLHGQGALSAIDTWPEGLRGNALPTALDLFPDRSPQTVTNASLTLMQGQLVRELVVIDDTVPDKHVFYQHNRPGIAVIEIDANHDGLAQLSQALAGHRQLAALHIVSHARDGVLQLGNSAITTAELSRRPEFMTSVNAALIDGGDVMFYGCELAKTAKGEALLELIAHGADVDAAASNDLTGWPTNDGDWDLEIQTGQIETTAPFSPNALQRFDDVLAINDATGKTITTSGFSGGYSNTKSYDVDATGYVLRLSTSSVSSSALYAGFGYVAVNFGGFLSDAEQLYIEFVSGASFDIDSLQAYSPAGNNTYVFTPSSGAPVNGNGFNLGFSTQALNFTNITKLTITRQDGLDLLSFDIDNLVIKNAAAPDSTPPVFQNSTPSVSGTTISQTTLTVRLDEIGTAYYVVVPDGAGAPTATQVKNGQNSSGGAAFRSGNLNVSSAGMDFNTNITALAAGTAYDLYVVAEDGVPNLQVSPTKVDFSTDPQDSDGNLTAAAGVTEPVALNYSVDTVGEAVNLFDFTLSDGGSGDGLALAVSTIVLNVTGTSSDTERSKVTWRLNGPDASNVTGVYSAGADTVTFSGLSISVADGGNEIYTVNGFYNDNTGLTHGNTIILSVDGDTDLTVAGTGTLMGSTTAVNNGTGTVITDDIAPAVSSLVPPADSTYIGGANLDFTVNYDEIVVVDPGMGMAPSIDLTIGATTRSATFVSGSGTTALLFRHTVLAGDEDLNGITLNANTVAANSGSLQDAAGNTANSSFSAPNLSAVLVDAVAPMVAIGNASVDPTMSGPVTYTVTYTGADTVTLANGDVTLNSTGDANGSVNVAGSGTSTRTVTISSITGDGTLGISLAADTAADTATNSAAAAGPSTTFMVDNTAPAVAIGSPSASVTNSGPITYTISYTDANSVTLANGDVTLNTTGDANGSVNVTGSGTSTRTVTISSITGDGTLGISLAADTAADTATNSAAAAGPSTTFMVDNTAPAVAIGSPSASVTNSGPITYTISYTDANSVTLANGDVTLNTTGDANGSVNVSGSGTGTRTVTISSITGDGTLGISLAADTAADTLGNGAATAGPSTTFTVDNTAPAVAIGSPSASATSTGPIDYTVTYTNADSVTLGDPNVSLNSTGTATGTATVSGSGTASRTVTISSISGDGTLGISLAAASAGDTAGNLATAAGPSATFTVDGTGPSVSNITRSNPMAALTNADTVDFGVTFSEAVQNVGAADFSVSGAGAGAAMVTATGGSGATYTVTVDVDDNGEGEVNLDLAGTNDIQDLVGTGLASLVPSGSDEPYTLDNTAPTLSIGPPSASLTRSGPITFSVTYLGADSVSLTQPDVTLNATGTAAGSVAVSGSGTANRTITVSSISGDGSLTIDIAMATAADDAGNSALAAGPSATLSVDNTAPAVAVDLLTTKDQTPALSGTVDDPNATLSLTVDGQMVVPTNAGDGTWSLPDNTLTTLALGTFDVAITATDLAGNQASDGTANELTIDPLSADLRIDKSDGVSVVGANDLLIYTIIVLNDGPDNVTGAMVADLLPPTLVNSSWTCVPLSIATCTGSGTGDIQESVDIPAGDGLVFTLLAMLDANFDTGQVVNTATVTPPVGTVDPDPSDNSSSDTNLSDIVYTNSFEPNLVVTALVDRKVRIERDRLAANLSPDGTPMLLARMQSSGPHLAAIEIFARRTGDRVELLVNRLLDQVWISGEWIPVHTPIAELK